MRRIRNPEIPGINTVMEYTKHYESLIAKARARVTNPVEYYERHHVLPKCLGGDDSSDNLVDLTPEEHYTAHLLLVKIYPKNHSLVLAASMMTVNRCNNKRYGWLKRKHAAVMREFQSGSKNSQFGKVWMHSIEKKSSIKVSEDEIPSKLLQGWSLGRVVNFDKLRSCVICGKKIKEKKDTCSTDCLKTHQKNLQKHKSPLFGREQEFIDYYKSSGSINKALKLMGFGGNNSHWGKHARKILASFV